MKKLVLVLIPLTISITLLAQYQEEPNEMRPTKSLNLSLLGDVSLISINFEKLLIVKPTFILSSKLGFGFNEEFQICAFGPCSSPPQKYLTIPHHVTANFGKGKSFFELGLGGTIIKGNKSQPYMLYPIIGYRIVPLRLNRANFRAFGQIPFWNNESNDIMFFPIGISFGICFE